MAAILKLLFVFMATVILKTIEVSGIMRKPLTPKWLDANARPLYTVFNIHLTLGLGGLGIVLPTADKQGFNQMETIGFGFLLLTALVGSVSRGFFSSHEPILVRWTDNDWRFGVIVPAFCGFACFAGAITMVLLRGRV